ncbi:hypothetical protein NMG60_11026970 [Bertholletia excelsa]
MATSPSPKNQTMDKQTQADQNQKSSKALVWDCESSLYDSFELKSFERQLGLAIASRSLSMPHLSDNRTRHPLPPPVRHVQRPKNPPSSLDPSRSLFGPFSARRLPTIR